MVIVQVNAFLVIAVIIDMGHGNTQGQGIHWAVSQASYLRNITINVYALSLVRLMYSPNATSAEMTRPRACLARTAHPHSLYVVCGIIALLCFSHVLLLDHCERSVYC